MDVSLKQRVITANSTNRLWSYYRFDLIKLDQGPSSSFLMVQVLRAAAAEMGTPVL